MRLDSQDFKKDEVENNEMFKKTNSDGSIELGFTSQPSSRLTSFHNAAEYLNKLLDEGYRVVNTRNEVAGDYATYTSDHKYVILENGRFCVGDAPMGDCPHYDHEWVKYTLAKEVEGNKPNFIENQDVNVIYTSRDGEITIETITVKESFGGYVKFNEEDSNFKIEDILKKVEDYFENFYGLEYMPYLIVTPDDNFTKKYIELIQVKKYEKIDKRIEDMEKSILKLKKERKEKINILDNRK